MMMKIPPDPTSQISTTAWRNIANNRIYREHFQHQPASQFNQSVRRYLTKTWQQQHLLTESASISGLLISWKSPTRLKMGEKSRFQSADYYCLVACFGKWNIIPLTNERAVGRLIWFSGPFFIKKKFSQKWIGHFWYFSLKRAYVGVCKAPIKSSSKEPWRHNYHFGQKTSFTVDHQVS